MGISVNSVYSQLTLCPQDGQVDDLHGAFSGFVFPQVKSSDGL